MHPRSGKKSCFLETLESRVLMSADTVGGTLSQATRIDFDSFYRGLVIDAQGAVSMGGVHSAIDTPADRDVFVFTSRFSDTLTVTLRRDNETNSRLDPQLTLVDAGNRVVMQSANAQGQAAKLTFHVDAGKNYYFQVDSLGHKTTGAYQMELWDSGGDVDHPAVVSLNSCGALNMENALNGVTDQDCFAFVAPVTGALTLDAKFSSNQGVSPLVLELTDSVTHTYWDAYASSQVAMPVTAGHHYSLCINASETGTFGSYSLKISTQRGKIGDALATAMPLFLDRTGAGGFSESGGAFSPGITPGVLSSSRVDFLAVDATVSGLMKVDLITSLDNKLSPVPASYGVRIYNANKQLVATSSKPVISSDTTAGWEFISADAQASFSVTAGARYYIEVLPLQPWGDYSLTVSTRAKI